MRTSPQPSEYSEGLGGYYPTRKHEESSHQEFIDEYNNNNFWEELINRLSERDLERELKLEGKKEISFKERCERIQKYEEKWSNEFEINDLNNIKTK